MEKKIYILVYGRFPTEKAYGIHAINQAKSFVRLGYKVELLYPQTKNKLTINQTPENYYEEKFNFLITKTNNKDITGYNFFQYLPNVFKKFLWIYKSFVWSKHISKQLEQNSIIWTTNPIVGFRVRKNNKIIFEQHGQARFFQKLFIFMLSLSNSYFVGTTNYSYRRLKKINQNSIYLPNGVDSSVFFTLIEKRDMLNIVYAVMLETYGVDKGVQDSLKKIIELLDEFKFKVTIIGGPKNKLDDLRNLVSESGFESNIELLDRMNQKDLAKKVREFDIGIVPYPKNKHMNKFASPLKIFEYLSSGVICLASDLDAHKEIKNEGMFYFQNENFNDFKLQLHHLISNKTDLILNQDKLKQNYKIFDLDNRNSKLLEFLRL